MQKTIVLGFIVCVLACSDASSGDVRDIGFDAKVDMSAFDADLEGIDCYQLTPQDCTPYTTQGLPPDTPPVCSIAYGHEYIAASECYRVDTPIEICIQANDEGDNGEQSFVSPDGKCYGAQTAYMGLPPGWRILDTYCGCLDENGDPVQPCASSPSEDFCE